MPGFVDVSNMTSQEIKRLGQMDDDYETPNRTWKAKSKSQGVRHSVDNVWGAACAAQRINGSYVKETQFRFDEDKNTTVIAKQRNRDVIVDLLANPALLTVEDIAQGQECRKFLQQDITLRGLKSKLTEFDGVISRVIAITDEFDSAKHKYELAVVACLPQSHTRTLERQAVQDRVCQTSGDHVGNPGDKVQLDVEIIKSNYSLQWNTWYATAVTPDNHAVFFAYRQQLGVGAKCTIYGTVKAHRDGSTQLNRVSII